MENSTILERFSKEFEKLSDVKTDCKLNFHEFAKDITA